MCVYNNLGFENIMYGWEKMVLFSETRGHSREHNYYEWILFYLFYFGSRLKQSYIIQIRIKFYYFARVCCICIINRVVIYSPTSEILVFFFIFFKKHFYEPQFNINSSIKDNTVVIAVRIQSRNILF